MSLLLLPFSVLVRGTHELIREGTSKVNYDILKEKVRNAALFFLQISTFFPALLWLWQGKVKSKSLLLQMQISRSW